MKDDFSIFNWLALSHEWHKQRKCDFIKWLNLSEELSKMIKSSELRPLFNMNVIDFFNPKEPMTSKILELIFSYKNDDGYVILRDFCEKFLGDSGFEIHDVSEPIIISEKQGHMDIRITESGKYAIIIENKLKGADFQRNQLARYIQFLKNEGFDEDQIYVVILPRYNDAFIPLSSWRLPQDYYKTKNSERRCAIIDETLCWCDLPNRILTPDEKAHCKKCITYWIESFSSRTKVLHTNLSEWMINVEDLIPRRELNVRSAILQFADYLNGLYINRIDQKLNMKITEFLRDKLELEVTKTSWNNLNNQIDEVVDLLKGLVSLRSEISSDFLNKWYENLKNKWPMLRNDPPKSFCILIKGMQFGCWWSEESDNKDSPICGIYCEEGKPTAYQIRVAEKILSKCGLPNSIIDDQWLTWYDTLEGDKMCDRIYTAAVELGYLKI